MLSNFKKKKKKSMKKTSKSRLPSTQQTRKNKFHRTKQAEKAKCSSALVLTAYPGRAVECQLEHVLLQASPAHGEEQEEHPCCTLVQQPLVFLPLQTPLAPSLWCPWGALPLSLHPALLSTTASAAVTNPDVMFSSQEAAAAGPAARRTRRCPRRAACTAPRSWRARCAPSRTQEHVDPARPTQERHPT